MKRNFVLVTIFQTIILLFSGCIHEYPYNVKGSIPGVGEDPTTHNAYIEVSYDLSWQEIIYNLDIGSKTKSAVNYDHRFVFEVRKDGKVICHDEEYLNDNDFALGHLKHRISTPLFPTDYEVAVWYDKLDENKQTKFDTGNLSHVVLKDLTTIDAESLQCAYAYSVLDLTESKHNTPDEITMELTMNHAAARFEIVASDVQDFITANKEALNQGDKFTVHLTFLDGCSEVFNVYSENPVFSAQALTLSGWMRLPFAEYDELKIAEGILFCDKEYTVTAKISVTNSALVTVRQTETFSFPVKRGYVTTITGDFLSNTIDGFFNIDSVWEDEIIIEI